ncbi:MAG: FMN-binding negative transcriptional regulator [Thermoflexales bacterium]
MYIPAHFDESRPEVLRALIDAHPLATLVTLTPDGLNANHIPLRLHAADVSHGILRGHVARSNAIWKDFDPRVDALAIFQGPDSYITPGYYATKQETGRVVPTWNYAVVHVYGSLRVIDDPAWLRPHLETLTATHEAARVEPWHVSDAPADYTGKLVQGIVGIELTITRMLGKWKVSQNQPASNQAGVVEGLRAHATENAARMADLVAERRKTEDSSR